VHKNAINPIEHGAKGMGHRERQLLAGRRQLAEIRNQRSGVKLISDLRLLSSVIDDFHGFPLAPEFWLLAPLCS
jgi:hypothetical protein